LNNYLTKVIKDEDIEPEMESVGTFVLGSILANEEFNGRGFNDHVCSTEFLKKIFSKGGFVSNSDVAADLIELDIGEFLIKNS